MPDEKQKQVAREAAFWLLELRGRLRHGLQRTREERNAAFTVWLLQSPEHVKAFLMASAMCSNVPTGRPGSARPRADLHPHPGAPSR